MVVLTERLLQRAKTGGACAEALRALRVGQPLDSLSAYILGWAVKIVPQREIDALASDLAGVALHGIDPYFLGVSGYGSGSGDG